MQHCLVLCSSEFQGRRLLQQITEPWLLSVTVSDEQDGADAVESEVQSVIGSPELLAALQASFSQVRQPSNLGDCDTYRGADVTSRSTCLGFKFHPKP